MDPNAAYQNYGGGPQGAFDRFSDDDNDEDAMDEIMN